jgi:hypothetical protein
MNFCLVKFQITDEKFYFVMNTEDVLFSKNIEIFEDDNLSSKDYHFIKSKLERGEIEWMDLRVNFLVFK